MKRQCFLPVLVLCGLVAGCSSQTVPTPTILGPHEEVRKENNLFLMQKSFDPWILKSTDPTNKIRAYIPDGNKGTLYDAANNPLQVYTGGSYVNGVIKGVTSTSSIEQAAESGFSQSLDLENGILTTMAGPQSTRIIQPSVGSSDWPTFWKTSDIAITGDPEAQQVTHAELFYLCGSLAAGTDHSIPPMGLSSDVYLGHIFWDAEIWMLPALLPQHPELAKSIVDYRFNRLAAAKSLAKRHGYDGAEFPWESADTGLEEAPAEFAEERHVTADVAYAAWQYYLWTGDNTFMMKEGWPILSQTANYWVSRVNLGSDGKYHIENVIGPDETAGQVTDDAWTNAVVQYNLKAADFAARVTHNEPDPKWATVADNIYLPYDSAKQLFLEYPKMDRARSQAKQADTQMLEYPLNYPMSQAAAGNTLDYYLKHTIDVGPAMTSSINAVIAARLGRSQQSLDLYHDSYRPFMRGPWDAFSEKRTKSDVYFTTGMGGNLQVLEYGFAGLNITSGNKTGLGELVARSGDAALYANPHLPPGWTGLTINGVHFRGATFNVEISAGNVLKITK